MTARSGSATQHADPQALLDDVPPRPFPTYDVLPYDAFLNDHLIPNTPFLLSPAATASWPARHLWASPPPAPESSSSDSPLPLPSSTVLRPNLAALRAYATHVVPVADTSTREFSEFARDELPLGDVLDVWERGGGGELYVKDWHLVAEIEARGGGPGGDGTGAGKKRVADEVYSPPPCFRDDWLSPPFDAPGGAAGRSADSTSTADFRFVYCGPAGTFTPLHRDVYGSYSWSANVVGRKVWWLFPPGAEAQLMERPGGDALTFDVRNKVAAERLGVKVLQGEGEVLFVPSGWHHQVVNIDFCISINHNFFSSPTLRRVYAALRASQARCAASILDVRTDIRTRLGDTVRPDGTPAWEAEWAEEVDGLLARDAGWGWSGFWACVLKNIKTPPAAPDLSPPVAQRDAFVRAVLEEYKVSKEYALLQPARNIVDEIARLIQ